jgi:hypothetical protein
MAEPSTRKRPEATATEAPAELHTLAVLHTAMTSIRFDIDELNEWIDARRAGSIRSR